MAILTLVFLALVTRYPITLAALYDLTDNWQGGSFWDNFLFEAIDDPTHGRVEYVATPSELFDTRFCRRIDT